MSHFSRSLQALSQKYGSQALIRNLTIPIELLEIETMAKSENETEETTVSENETVELTSPVNEHSSLTNSVDKNVDLTSSENGNDALKITENGKIGITNSEDENSLMANYDTKDPYLASSDNKNSQLIKSDNKNSFVSNSENLTTNQNSDSNHKPSTKSSIKLPCSVNHQAQDNTWTVSLKSMIVGAGYDELSKLKGISKVVTKLLIIVLEHFIDFFKMDDIVGLDNACLTTSLLSKEFLDLDPTDLFAKAKQAYPNSALMIRSLNKAHHDSYIEKLEKNTRAHLLVNRQIYLIDQPEQALKKRDSKRDLKLLEDGRYKFRKLDDDSSLDSFPNSLPNVSPNFSPNSIPDSSPDSSSVGTTPTTFSDFQSVISLYNQLYLDKYSASNVQFTALFLQELVREGAITIFLMENQTGQACGCLGLIEEEGILTAPLLGYRTELAQSEGLYRRLSIFITQYCLEKGFKQNLSAGAPDFKKNRGAKPTLEYTAVYVDHLPWYRRAAWQLLAWTCQHYYGPMLVKKGL
ncbi:hypothetical protein ACEE04_00135 [Streptococcus porcinus]|uniref:hypothetical protein n=1 Tax=Streptococcus porcinus TaxID=1340 RepID=UPI00196207CE|nr:hypothetical protein [Streptococcus porcinus]